jgi:hypothetical protein
MATMRATQVRKRLFIPLPLADDFPLLEYVRASHETRRGEG